MALSSDIRAQHPAIVLLRFTVGGLMLFHGVAKLTRGIAPIQGLLAQAGLPTWLAFGVFIGEIVAPLLVVAGIGVRWAALLIVVNMLFAIGLAHRNDLFAIGPSGGYRLELQLFFLLGSVVIAWLAGSRRGVRA